MSGDDMLRLQQRQMVGHQANYLGGLKPPEPTLPGRLQGLLDGGEAHGRMDARVDRLRDRYHDLHYAVRHNTFGWLLGPKVAALLDADREVAEAKRDRAKQEQRNKELVAEVLDAIHESYAKIRREAVEQAVQDRKVAEDNAAAAKRRRPRAEEPKPEGPQPQ